MKGYYNRILFFVIVLVSSIVQVRAQQDFPISFQMDHPLFSNPSLSALNENSTMIQSAYKTQLNNAFSNVGIKSLYFAAERSIIKNEMSVGLVVLSNTINRTALNDLNFMLNYNYQINLQQNEKGNVTQKINFGLQAGFRQWSFSASNLTFGSQYDPSYLGGYNPNLSSSIQLPEYKIVFDANVGANFTHQFHNNTIFNGGVALFHIFKPRTNFTETIDRVAFKYVFHSSLEVSHTSDISIIYSALYFHQASFNILEIGGMVKYEIDSKTTFYAGIFYRTPKILIPHISLKYNNLEIGLSLETHINTSYNNLFNTSLSYHF